MGIDCSNLLIKNTYLNTVFYLVAMLTPIVSVTSCTQPPVESKPLDPAECMENIPRDVKGLVILAGQRTSKSIIADMRPVICSAHVLFQTMLGEHKHINDGRVVFKVVVEFNGEVINASVTESTIQSEEFLGKVTDWILTSDFRGWERDDVDSVFLYPVTFGTLGTVQK